VEYRGKLRAASWMDIPDWVRESLGQSLVAFVRSCAVLDKRASWTAVCAAAQSMSSAASHEPLLRGSRVRSERFRHPLYAGALACRSLPNAPSPWTRA
jgi:hypothetical protein